MTSSPTLQTDSALGPRREIVEAGAGCGKTTRLVAKYLEALGLDSSGAYKRRYHPGQVIALTFTEEAARQMKERVLKKLDEQKQESLKAEVLESSQISTFHSLCFRLIRPHLFSLGYTEGSSLTLPEIAIARRSRYIIQQASRFDKREILLSHLNERELVESTLKLWFSKNLTSQVASSQKWLHSFWEQILWAKEQIKKAHLEFPNDLSTEKVTWLGTLQNILSTLDTPEALIHLDAGSLNFQRGSKAAKEKFSDLQNFAKTLRETFEKKLHLSALPQSLADDEQVQKILIEFVQLCRTLGPKILDYSALEYELSTLLEKKSIEELGLKAPKLILVDEFQDTNRTQFSIVSALSNAETEWFFVGDPKQSIYQFRGADVSLFLELSKTLQKTELSTNYRSDPPTLEWTNAIQKTIFEKKLAESDREGGFNPPPQYLGSGKKMDAPFSPTDIFVSVHLSPSKKEKFFELLLNKLQTRLAQNEECAVLFLTWKRLLDFSNYLEQHSIPFEISGAQHELDHLLSFVFADFLDWTANPASTLGLASLLRWCEKFDQLNILRESMPQFPPRLLSLEVSEKFLAQLLINEKDLSLSEYLGRFASLIQPSRFHRGQNWVAAMEAYLKELSRQNVETHFSKTEIAKHIRKYAPLSESQCPLILPLHKSPGHPPKGEFIIQQKPLKLLTIHGSKGLEFDHVYLPELYEKKQSRFSSSSGGEDDSSSVSFNVQLFDAHLKIKRPSLLYLASKREQEAKIESERKRLFYVAITRSKKTVELFTHSYNPAKAKADPLSEFFGCPKINPYYWNQALENTPHESPHFRKIVLENSEQKKEALHANTIHTAETHWKLPLSIKTQNQQNSLAPQPSEALSSEYFFQGGVRDYLSSLKKSTSESKETHTKVSSVRFSSTAKFVSSSGPSLALKQANRGKILHSLLEIWSGEKNSLTTLLKQIPEPELMRSALQAIRKLDALQEYWTAAQGKSPKLFREFELLIHLPNARLTGIADAVLFQNNQQLLIIDWKTGSSMNTLSEEERLSSLSDQLSLYAKAFPEWTIQGIGVGIEWPKDESSTANAAVIFNEALS